MTRLFVFGALALTLALWSCGGAEKQPQTAGTVVIDTIPTIPDSIKNKPKHPIEKESWRLLTYTQNGESQPMLGSDSVSVTIEFLYGVATGSTGCNDFRVNYAIGEGGQLTFEEPLSHSSRTCRGLMTQERFVQDMIRETKSFVLTSSDRQLELISPSGRLIYIRVIK